MPEVNFVNSSLKKGFSCGGLIARTLPDPAGSASVIPESVQVGDEFWMAHALLQAMNGVGWASPNPSVGCVLVEDDRIVAAGFTQNYGGKHAERMAFEYLLAQGEIDPGRKLRVYVTLEPCTHHGKQPPCVDLLFHPAVKEVVIGCVDPDPRVSGTGITALKNAGKVVRTGVLGPELRAWHLPFLNQRERKRPLWIAKWAQNQDGLLADVDGNSKWITNAQSRAYTHWLRQKYDAILVGAGTWLQDQPRLTVRDCAQPHRRNPVILIHDPRQKLDPKGLPECVRLYQQASITEMVSAVESTDFGFELQSVFCEGGARTLNQLFKENRIDLVHRFVGNKDFGDRSIESPHRVHGFAPELDSKWMCTTLCKLEYDWLQEWVNCS